MFCCCCFLLVTPLTLHLLPPIFVMFPVSTKDMQNSGQEVGCFAQDVYVTVRTCYRQRVAILQLTSPSCSSVTCLPSITMRFWFMNHHHCDVDVRAQELCEQRGGPGLIPYPTLLLSLVSRTVFVDVKHHGKRCLCHWNRMTFGIACCHAH